VLPAASGADFQSNPTLATGDFKISKDGGAWANLATLPTVSPASSVQVIVQLSAAEAECTTAVVAAIDTATKQWKDNAWAVHTPLAEGGLCGKITSGTPTTTTFVSSQLAGAQTDHYKDVWIKFLTGACAGAICRVTAFNAGTDTATVTALPTAPAVGDVWEALL
jgi:hypothetical protein